MKILQQKRKKISVETAFIKNKIDMGMNYKYESEKIIKVFFFLSCLNVFFNNLRTFLVKNEEDIVQFNNTLVNTKSASILFFILASINEKNVALFKLVMIPVFLSVLESVLILIVTFTGTVGGENKYHPRPKKISTPLI